MSGVESFYDEIIESAFEVHEANGWRSSRSAQRRYRVAAELCEFRDGDAVLDVGCGTAEFYKYLWDSGLKPEYAGIDITPRMIEVANQRHDGITLWDGDFVEFESLPKFDHIVAIGTMGAVPHEKRENAVKEFLEQALRLAEKTIVFTMLIDRATDNDGIEDLNWLVPEDYVLPTVRKCVGNKPLVLRADYHPFEVMVAIRLRGF